MKNNREYLKRLVLFFRTFWKWFLLVWSLAILMNVCNLSYSVAIGRIIDALNRTSITEAYWWVGFFVFGSVTGKLVGGLKETFEIKELDYDVAGFIGLKTSLKTKELSIGQHLNRNSGLQQSLVEKGASGLNRLAEQVVNQISYMFLQVAVAVAVTFFWDWKLAIMLLLYALAFGYFTYLINSNKEELNRLVDLEHRSVKAFTEYLRNISMLLLNANADRGILNWQKKRQEMEQASKKFWLRYNRRRTMLQVSNSVFFATVLYYTIFQCQVGKFSIGQIVTFLSWSFMAINSLQNLSNFQRQLIRINVDIKKYFAFLDINPAIKRPEVEERTEFFGGIEFRKVYFAHPTDDYFSEFSKKESATASRHVLRGISFKIRPKEKIAIVGLSGAGKSTLMAMLMRAYLPDSGTILLDGTDYDMIDPDKFRRQVGLVEQNIQLMDDTLRENLLIGLNGRADSVSDEELWEVMKLANITKFQDRLTEGLETRIGEGGIKLSGGEKQRVAIARALIKNPSIIIFDEATSNLDGITEAELREAIVNANKNRTSISIAHRLATVINSDRIIVIDKGRVIAEGRHTELKEKCQVYRQLIKTQTAVF